VRNPNQPVETVGAKTCAAAHLGVASRLSWLVGRSRIKLASRKQPDGVSAKAVMGVGISPASAYVEGGEFNSQVHHLG